MLIVRIEELKAGPVADAGADTAGGAGVCVAGLGADTGGGVLLITGAGFTGNGATGLGGGLMGRGGKLGTELTGCEGRLGGGVKEPRGSVDGGGVDDVTGEFGVVTSVIRITHSP